MKKGVILNNIGSPESPNTQSVRVYLREFLMDPDVIELPYFLRYILVYFIISLFRAPKSAAKYQKIWTEKGSPLISITKSIADKMETFNPELAVESGMIFQKPNINMALFQLFEKSKDLEFIYFIPMYPQFSAATTDASIKKMRGIWEQEKLKYPNVKSVFVMKPFYRWDRFIDNTAGKIKAFSLHEYDRILFSYHGLPRSAILKNPHCQLDNQCCASGAEKNCYRSQCLFTTKLVAQKLNLETPITTFQSRLGPAEWIQPYTDVELVTLAREGIKKILVVCPAFTVDCLETLEEIQIENRKMFLQAGGQRFDYVPCLNDDDNWCQDLASVIDRPEYFDRL